jgi:maleylpyruvate isomerase
MTTSVREQVQSSHARLAHTLSSLTDADARRPSLLPGWTVGHVLTHIARNADSHVRMLDGAARGEVADQYPGGNAQRAADIDAGSRRPAAQLVDDVVASASRLESAWDATPDDVWRTGQGRVVGGIWPLADLPFRRWREVEIHHVDLGLGYGFADWPDAYVEVELARTLAELPPRLASGTAVALHATDTGERWVVPERSADGRPVEGDRRLLLAWLVGRAGDPSFPPLGPW